MPLETAIHAGNYVIITYIISNQIVNMHKALMNAMLSYSQSLYFKRLKML